MHNTPEPFNIIIKPQPREEFEQEVIELREALRKQVAKKDIDCYETMTIRESYNILAMAKGKFTITMQQLLDGLSCDYDLDSDEDFWTFADHVDHMMDLEYASVSLYPRYTSFEKPHKWVFVLFWHYGISSMLYYYVLRLEKAGVHFYLRDPEKVLKSFGYWVRSRRRDYKLTDKNND